MSTNDLVIPERSRDIGDFIVGRLLPFRKKRMVGPFIFIDHMGPTQMGKGKFMDVDQHPHIGLATLTYLLSGEVEHADSIGTKQLIRPGSVNWMVAGSGVSHTERTPLALREADSYLMHGYQIWVALPKEFEKVAPSFHHFSADELPNWQEEDLDFRLIAGEAFGKKSPLPVHSPLFMLELKSVSAGEIDLSGKLKGEIGICVVKGAIQACKNRVEAGNLLVSKEEDVCKLSLEADSHIIFFGGEALPEKRHIYWNFVASEAENIEEAKEKWEAWDWPKVPNDETYVPLPGK
tara:strand:+ start:249761 stop:250636 length:876 start_codon:yes stop_codon:yes gene_type:complete